MELKDLIAAGQAAVVSAVSKADKFWLDSRRVAAVMALGVAALGMVPTPSQAGGFDDAFRSAVTAVTRGQRNGGDIAGVVVGAQRGYSERARAEQEAQQRREATERGEVYQPGGTYNSGVRSFEGTRAKNVSFESVRPQDPRQQLSSRAAQHATAPAAVSAARKYPSVDPSLMIAIGKEMGRPEAATMAGSFEQMAARLNSLQAQCDDLRVAPEAKVTCALGAYVHKSATVDLNVRPTSEELDMVGKVLKQWEFLSASPHEVREASDTFRDVRQLQMPHSTAVPG